MITVSKATETKMIERTNWKKMTLIGVVRGELQLGFEKKNVSDVLLAILLNLEKKTA